MIELITYSDGGARGNPGPAAFGVVVQDSTGKVVESFGTYIGSTTNNQAEYRGLIAALLTAEKHGAKTVKCFLDSELIVKQMKGEYRVKEAGLKLLHDEAKTAAGKFSGVTYIHITRDKNKLADSLVNQALDSAI
jgi:ribonuclease HI